MALIEGVGDDVAVVVLCLTLGLGFVTFMYLRLLESVHRNTTVHSADPAQANETQSSSNSADTPLQTDYNQRQEMNQTREDVDLPQRTTSSESSLVQELVETCASSSERLDDEDENITELETADTVVSNDSADATPSEDRGDDSTAAPEATQRTENTTRNRFQSSQTQSNDEGAQSTDSILVRVKYNERNMDVEVSKTTTLMEFKRRCFPREVEEGKLVRLIYSGHLLHNDQQSLEDCGVGHLAVIHCQISENRHEPEQQGTDTELDLGPILVPLLGLLLAGCWYAYHSHPNLFTTTSVLILLFLTFLYCLFLYATMSSHGSRQ